MLLMIGFSVFILSFLLTAGIRKYALKLSLLDIPNHRSAHRLPIPRGGGVAIAFSFLLAVLLLYQGQLVSVTLTWVLLLSGIFIGVLGLLDDICNIPASYRILMHFSTAILVLYGLGGMPVIKILDYVLPTGIFINILAVVYLVWLLNLYNFMDGIDGLAGVEALSVCLGGAFLYWLNANDRLMILPLMLAVSVAGFLCWNFPKARIFMGDVGSGFLGMILGVLSIQAASIRGQLFLGWLILLGVFIVDATWTLLQRAWRGEKVYEAHSTHAYQQAARVLKSHPKTTCLVLAINVFWLFPLAVLVECNQIQPFLGLFVAYIPLVFLAIKLGAGKRENAIIS